MIIYMQLVVSGVLRNAARERHKFEAVLKYCRNFLITLKGEERRKVHA